MGLGEEWRQDYLGHRKDPSIIGYKDKWEEILNNLQFSILGV